MGAALTCTRRSDDLAEKKDRVTFSNCEEDEESLWVFINPNSGTGRSLETFCRKVAPVFDKNEIRYKAHITDRPNYVRDMMITSTKLGKLNGILILSGDGLVFEAINGLMHRTDGFQILAGLPIGIVPSGSGNGLLCSLLAKYGTELKPKAILEKAIEVVTSPTAKAESVALYAVRTDTQEYAAFLSVGWGLMADIDIESEKWRRSLGSHRFSCMGLIRSLNLRSYHGRLSYVPYKAKDYTPSSNVFNVSDETVGQKYSLDTPNQWAIHDDDKSEEVVIESTFVNVYAVFCAHIAADGPFAPTAKLEDNRIHLSYILLEDVQSRRDIIKFLLALGKGEHMKLPFVKTVEASSIKLDNISHGSNVVLDGELIEATKIEVFSTQNTFSVFSPAE